MMRIFIEPADVDPRNGPPMTPDGKCPKCGSDDIDEGFGLAYGGYGPYQSCNKCPWFHKEQCDE